MIDKAELDCPFCEFGLSTLTSEPRILEHRGQQKSVLSYYYKCNLCNEQFTTGECDDKTLKNLYGMKQYEIKFTDGTKIRFHSGSDSKFFVYTFKANVKRYCVNDNGFTVVLRSDYTHIGICTKQEDVSFLPDSLIQVYPREQIMSMKIIDPRLYMADNNNTNLDDESDKKS